VLSRQPATFAAVMPIVILLAAAPPRPADTRAVPGKTAFIREYQGNFGTIKLPGCGLPYDSLFDPFLLSEWTHDRPCFERMMQAHATRGDNRVVIDPRSDYHGQVTVVDLYHDPETFAAFVSDIRSHTNARGEGFEVLLFLSADGHIPSFIDARTGRRDLEAEAHWRRDVSALLARVGSQIAGVSPCWECRDQRDYMRPATYAMMGQFLRQQLRDAWMGVHLIKGSASVSSRRCTDEANADCRAEPDDPYGGSEPAFWATCRREGWCDGLLYQFADGPEYLEPDRHPNYTQAPGALGRWWEVVVRLGNDPRSEATAQGNRHGWVQVDLLAFEHVFDAYNNRSTEAYAIEFCKRALTYGGWGCGSASYRREGG